MFPTTCMQGRNFQPQIEIIIMQIHTKIVSIYQQLKSLEEDGGFEVIQVVAIRGQIATSRDTFTLVAIQILMPRFLIIRVLVEHQPILQGCR